MDGGIAVIRPNIVYDPTGIAEYPGKPRFAHIDILEE